MPSPINVQRIQLGQLKTPQDVAALTKHLQTLYNSTINVTTGQGAPTFTPAKIGHEYIDTVGKKVYKSTGNTSKSDWQVLN